MFSRDGNKPTLWCVFGDNPFLSVSRGDHIGETRIVRLLSKVFDVYYNGVLVEEQSAQIGSDNPVALPDRNYDLYYVRNNPKIFKQLPSPKMCMAYPYDPESFECADAIVVTTDVWRNVLQKSFSYVKEELFFAKTYPSKLEVDKPIIQIKQYIDPLISPKPGESNNQKVRNLRYLYTNSMSFGFFGRLAEDSLPIYTIEKLHGFSEHNKFYAPLTIFGGKIRSSLGTQKDLPQPSVYVGDIPYEEVSSHIRALDCTLAGEGVDDFVLGSNKVLDSIGLGIPVLGVKNGVREEYLGTSYPLLLNEDSGDDEILKDFLNKISLRESKLSLGLIRDLNTMEQAEIHLRNQLESNSIGSWEL